jgi:hypothetical protein
MSTAFPQNPNIDIIRSNIAADAVLAPRRCETHFHILVRLSDEIQ